MVPAELLNRFGKLFAFRVIGTGMTDALIDDGDVVVIRPATRADNGEMVLALFNEEAEEILRRFYSEGDYVRLKPANSTMDPIDAPTENIEVRGKVMGMIRNLG